LLEGNEKGIRKGGNQMTKSHDECFDCSAKIEDGKCRIAFRADGARIKKVLVCENCHQEWRERVRRGGTCVFCGKEIDYKEIGYEVLDCVDCAGKTTYETFKDLKGECEYCGGEIELPLEERWKAYGGFLFVCEACGKSQKKLFGPDDEPPDLIA
jgi:ribosomal protein L24E